MGTGRNLTCTQSALTPYLGILNFKRIVILVLDSLGVGELPDAAAFGDQGSNTLKHTDAALKGLKIPNLQAMGLLNLIHSERSPQRTSAFFARMSEISQGKDTTTGHWEMMSLPLHEPLSHFPNGFPSALMTKWQEMTKLGFLGNKAASGTQIIDELGAEHLSTGSPIVYTSADSVFQIAAHEEKFGLENLYKLCQSTRELLDAGDFKVGRVIARPFLGKPGEFKRTSNRRDFSLKPPARTVLNELDERNFSVLGVGKIPSIFGFEGITESLEAHNDQEAFDATLEALKKKSALIFTNLNDLDMLYGHRRDAEGYGHQLEWIDAQLPRLQAAMSEDDLLIITADHGNDPTFKGTDHTREYVPLLLWSPRFKEAEASKKRIKDRKTFSDIGQSLSENFGIPKAAHGESFLSEIA